MAPSVAEVPVCGALGDQQAALVGQACFDVGEAKKHVWHRMLSAAQHRRGGGGQPPRHAHNSRLSDAREKGRSIAWEGSIAIAGALVQWLRDNLGFIQHAAEIEPLARNVEDNGGAYIVPAFSGLFAPYWRSDARGVIVGFDPLH